MSEKWIKARLDSIGDVVAGGTPSTGNEEYWGGDVSFVTPADLSRVTGSTIEVTERTITECGLKNSAANLLPPSSIVVSTRAPIGYIALTVGKSATNQGCKSVVLNECQFPLFHCYNLHRYVPEMWRLGVGTTFSEISKSDLSRISVVYPKDPESQRHIAEVLSTCDEVIEKSERAAEKYRQIKAGMLTDLLTRGLDGRGRLRPPPSVAPELYKDSELGPIPREWEVKRLGDESVSVINPPAGPLPIAFVYIDLESVKGGVLLQENLISREEAPSRAQRNVSVGDILYQLVRPYQMNNLLFRKSSALNYVASTGYALIRAAGDAGYLFQYVHTTEFVNKVLSMCMGTGYPAITPNNLSKILVRVPSFLEQRAIAERLAAVDERIAAEVKAAEKYRKVKAGLMEKLLTPPAGAEIEDRTQEVAG